MMMSKVKWKKIKKRVAWTRASRHNDRVIRDMSDMNKDELIDKVMEDVANGNISGEEVIGMVDYLIGLLNSNQVREFADMYDYLSEI